MSQPKRSIRTSFLFTVMLLGAALLAPPVFAQAAGDVQYILCMDLIQSAGPAPGPGYSGCLEASAVGLDVGRAMKESGEKGGTSDMNIGVGVLSPVTVRKPSDGTSARLFTYAVNGNSMGDVTLIAREQRAGWSSPETTLEIKLERTFVKSMRLDSSELVESIDLYYNKIQLTSFEYDSSGKRIDTSTRCWDKVRSIPSCSL